MLNGRTNTVIDRWWPIHGSACGSDVAERPKTSLQDAYRNWREERDISAIEQALGQLSERQLNLIGMSRKTLCGDVSGLIDRAEAGRQIVDEILYIVDDRPRRVPLPPPTG